MRSFMGRDILSLKDFERHEFFRVFEIADRLKPFAENRQNTDLLKEKNPGYCILPAQYPHASGARSRHASVRRTCYRLFRRQNDPRR